MGHGEREHASSPGASGSHLLAEDEELSCKHRGKCGGCGGLECRAASV